MSFDGYVFSNSIIDRRQDWQAALDTLDFKIELLFDQDVMTRGGHLPAIWQGREAGFECGPTDLHEIVDLYHDFDLRGPWTYVYAFHWATLTGNLGAWMAMAAYARATNGVVFDPQEGAVLTPEAAAREARSAEREFPRLEKLYNEL